jgi:hypothetical protein
MSIVTDHSQYGDLLSYRDNYGNEYFNTNQTVLERVYWSNPKDSRVKPEEPLYEHMTALTPQYKRTIKPVQRYYTTAYGVNFVYDRNPVYLDTYNDPDWALPIRLKIQDVSANLSSSIAEWKKAHEGFVFFAKEMLRIKRAIKSRRRGSVLNFCDVSATHLAVHFGIKPLVQDLYNVVEKFNNAKPVIRVHAKAKSLNTWDYSNYGYQTIGVWTNTDYVTAYVTPKDHTGIDLGNPIEWAWELIPFSFVVDWALPVGNYLTALFALQQVDVLAVCVSHRRKFKGDYLVDLSYWPSNNGMGEPGSVEYTRHWREVPNGIPLPALPKFDLTDSLLALRHAVALLHQLRSCS